MSKLLEEAKENRDKALSEAKRSHGDGERGLYSGWQEAVDLIEKHEKPKGLLQVYPPSLVLNEEQQVLYTELKYAYQSFCRIIPDDKDNAISAICNVLEGTEDYVAIPVLKKFISEVE